MHVALLLILLQAAPAEQELPKVRVATEFRGFKTDDHKAYTVMGVNYFRPGTGWAPQIWKKFDEEATRKDFAILRSHGMNCVRVFLTYGSFYTEPGKLSPEGLEKFDRFLKIAEEAGIYVHPTGPDHWEGLPKWVDRVDRFCAEGNLKALEDFWRLFAGRYRGRNVIFAYDLLNEPFVNWKGPTKQARWNEWLKTKYGTREKTAAAWGVAADTLAWGSVPIADDHDSPMNRKLLDYQTFREHLADEWTRRQAEAIKKADPEALVTVGLIQWSVPVYLPAGPKHYPGFRPSRQARYLDFMEIHFYPIVRGPYRYESAESRDRNLSYLETIVRETAGTGKPVVVAEFGWYGGGHFYGKPQWKGTEEQQSEYCASAVETTRGMAAGWLNWGMYDAPEARDVSLYTGLFKPDGTPKAWALRFQAMAKDVRERPYYPGPLPLRPDVDWDACLTSAGARARILDDCFRSFVLDKVRERK